MTQTLPIIERESVGRNSLATLDIVGDLLAEQHDLSAVERFSVWHDLEHSSGDITALAPSKRVAERPSMFREPAQARYYRSLLPATSPGAGQQYAFRVDLDACSGCKACVVACHTLNGLDEDESWRRVGMVNRADDSMQGHGLSIIQHVTTACHHCEDPGCLRGCPVKAYDKDPITGIVRHLDDQCIGCKYCTMMCPYEVPQYSQRLGIVRKCDMCHQRLSVGEAPACVQSCPNEAIAIELINVSQPLADAEVRLAPGAPRSSITKPTTRYVSRRRGSDPFADSIPQDAGVDHVAESHWPLALMLVATQVSVGMLLVERIASLLGLLVNAALPTDTTAINVTGSLAVALLGMLIAPLHLGQPLRAWRVFLGLRTSWLSREAVVLGKYVGLLAAATLLYWLPSLRAWIPESVPARVPVAMPAIVLSLAIAVGVIGLCCSAMIYVATQRQLWRSSRTFSRFFGTAVVGGAASTACVLFAADAWAGWVTAMVLAAVGMLSAKLLWEWRMQLAPAQAEDTDEDRRSRRLVSNELRSTRTLRLFAGAAAVALWLLAIAGMIAGAGELTLAVLIAAWLCCLIGEFAERLLYFQSVVHDRMPGTLQ